MDVIAPTACPLKHLLEQQRAARAARIIVDRARCCVQANDKLVKGILADLDDEKSSVPAYRELLVEVTMTCEADEKVLP